MTQNLKIIIGLGKTGLSCVRYLVPRTDNLVVIDSRENPPGLEEFKKNFPKVPIYLGKFDEKIIAQAAELIVSPGISLKEPAIAKQIAKDLPAIGDIELFARAAKGPIVAITGTNGKSTVTTLVGEMSKAAGLNVKVGGNLGIPALDLLDDKADLYVLELSSFQLETTHSLKTITAAVLNISPDHMDRYESLNEYISAKQRIYQHCKKPVINRNDSMSFSSLKDLRHTISFGLDKPKNGEFGLDGNYLVYGEKKLLTVDELQIKGRQNIANALAALALGHAANLSMTAMLATLKTFQGLPHRCQWIANTAGIDWYNDSKGTNVSSTLAAIDGLGSVIAGKLILIAGGQGKQQDFSPLIQPVKNYVREVILIGEDAQLIATTLRNSTAVTFANNLQEAVQLSRKMAKKGDAILLSPACASFDMFNNFEHRGEVFMSLVRDL